MATKSTKVVKQAKATQSIRNQTVEWQVFKWISLVYLVLIGLFLLRQAVGFAQTLGGATAGDQLAALPISPLGAYAVAWPVVFYLRQKVLDGTLAFGTWLRAITIILVVWLGFALFSLYVFSIVSLFWF